MIVIRKEQMKVLSEAKIGLYLKELLKEITASNPEISNSLPDGQLLELVQEGYARCKESKLKFDGEIKQFITYVLLYGLDFEKSGQPGFHPDTESYMKGVMKDTFIHFECESADYFKLSDLPNTGKGMLVTGDKLGKDSNGKAFITTEDSIKAIAHGVSGTMKDKRVVAIVLADALVTAYKHEQIKTVADVNVHKFTLSLNEDDIHIKESAPEPYNKGGVRVRSGAFFITRIEWKVKDYYYLGEREETKRGNAYYKYLSFQHITSEEEIKDHIEFVDRTKFRLKFPDTKAHYPAAIHPQEDGDGYIGAGGYFADLQVKVEGIAYAKKQGKYVPQKFERILNDVSKQNSEFKVNEDLSKTSLILEDAPGKYKGKNLKVSQGDYFVTKLSWRVKRFTWGDGSPAQPRGLDSYRSFQEITEEKKIRAHLEFIDRYEYKLKFPDAVSGSPVNDEPRIDDGFIVFGDYYADLEVKVEMIVYDNYIYGIAGAGYIYLSSCLGACGPKAFGSTVLHELGHNMGMSYMTKGPTREDLGRPGSEEIPGIPFPDTVENGGVTYVKHGHYGNHCASGIKDVSVSDFDNNTAEAEYECIMFGGGDLTKEREYKFCDLCKEYIEADVQENVWER